MLETAPTWRPNETPSPGVIAVQNVQETDLAWALIEVAKPHLNRLERNYAFVTTGAGDTFAAIHHLLKLIAVKGNPLSPSLVRLCNMARLVRLS
jgi:hypothetical protein